MLWELFFGGDMIKPENDITGKVFNRLKVIGYSHTDKHWNKLWNCLCECGKSTVVNGTNLKNGNTKSCGCLQRDKSTKHGKAKTRIYTIWQHMNYRCYNTNSISYKYYGKRGIEVCKEWHNFQDFNKWAMEGGYNDSLQIDRIDNNGNYCPQNCRWVTRKENMRNKRQGNQYTCKKKKVVV